MRYWIQWKAGVECYYSMHNLRDQKAVLGWWQKKHQDWRGIELLYYVLIDTSGKRQARNIIATALKGNTPKYHIAEVGMSFLPSSIKYPLKKWMKERIFESQTVEYESSLEPD